MTADPADPHDALVELPAKTHAEASRQRRDAVSGKVMPEETLLRFVASPTGEIVFDIARKLPGRGVWIAADRVSLEQAVKRDAFSRSLKTKVRSSPALVGEVEARLTARLLGGLGLARRAGELISGFEKTAAAVSGGRVAWLVEASDGAADGRGSSCPSSPSPPALRTSSRCSIRRRWGWPWGWRMRYTAFLAGRAADRWTLDVRRLEGFRPLTPSGWAAARAVTDEGAAGSIRSRPSRFRLDVLKLEASRPRGADE